MCPYSPQKMVGETIHREREREGGKERGREGGREGGRERAAARCGLYRPPYIWIPFTQCLRERERVSATSQYGEDGGRGRALFEVESI